MQIPQAVVQVRTYSSNEHYRLTLVNRIAVKATFTVSGTLTHCMHVLPFFSLYQLSRVKGPKRVRCDS